MSEGHYTKQEQDELWDGFGDRHARQIGPDATEQIVLGIIEQQKKMGLIGRQRPMPERYKRSTQVVGVEEGELNGEETS